MPVKTLDEYLKQAKTITKQTQAKTTTQTIYKIIGFYKETQFQETPIGKIPKEWKIVRLGDVAKIDTKAVVPKSGIKYYYIGLEDIESGAGRLLKRSDDLTDGSEIRSTKYLFTANHVLYGKLRPYLNKVALPSRDGICSTDILPILPNMEVILKEYLSYVLLHDRFVSYATARMKGTNHPRINPKEVLRYKFPLPPIQEQKNIVDTLSAFDAWIDAEKRRKEKLEHLKRGLMELLLTGLIRVRIEGFLLGDASWLGRVVLRIILLMSLLGVVGGMLILRV